MVKIDQELTTCSMCFKLRHFRCLGNCACSICNTQYNKPPKISSSKKRPTGTRVKREVYTPKPSLRGRSEVPLELRKEIEGKMQDGHTIGMLLREYQGQEITRRKLQTIRLALEGKTHGDRLPKEPISTLPPDVYKKVQQELLNEKPMKRIAREYGISREKVKTVRKHLANQG